MKSKFLYGCVDNINEIMTYINSIRSIATQIYIIP